MGFLDNFVKNAKERKIEEMSKEDIHELLRTKKLDDITLNAIAKKLQVGEPKLEKGFIFEPSDAVNFSALQNKIRVALGLFVRGDQVQDSKNFMVYEYEMNRGNDEYGFHGFANKHLLANKGITEADIVVPESIMGVKVNSLEDAFHNTKDYKLNVDIQAKGVSINRMMASSGLTSIPNFAAMKANIIDTEFSASDADGPDGDVWYKLINIGPNYICTDIIQSEHISLQQKLDFVIQNYNSPHRPTKAIAQEIGERYFGIQQDQDFIAKSQLDAVDKKIAILENSASDIEKTTFCAECVICGCKGEIDKHILKELQKQLGIKDRDSIVSAYISTLNPDDLIIHKLNAVNANRETIPVYYITLPIRTLETDYKQPTYIFNPQTGDFTHEGKAAQINDNRILLSTKSGPKAIEDVELVTEKEAIINAIANKDSLIANDVLTNDTTTIPTTSFDDKEIEEI